MRKKERKKEIKLNSGKDKKEKKSKVDGKERKKGRH